MKKLLLATAAVLAFASGAANADVLFGTSGYWTTRMVTQTFNGKPICLMSVDAKSATGATGQTRIKWFPDDNRTIVEIYKSDWRFAAGLQVPMTITFDRAPREGTGSTYIYKGQHMVTIGINNDTDGILEDFANADRLSISFNEGNEGDWVAKMDGSRVALQRFYLCKDMVRDAGYGTPTSPAAPQPTTLPVAPRPQGSTWPISPASLHVPPAQDLN